MDTETSSTSTQLLEVKRLLGKNYRKVLNEATGYSIRRVSQVFRDEDITHPILTKAIELAQQIKEKNSSIQDKLKSI